MAGTAPASRVEIPPVTAGHRPRVIIVGGGFAGTHAAKALADLPVYIAIVDRRNHFTFQPLLYQVALAVLSPANIAAPIRTIVRHKQNIEVLMDEVIGFDLDQRQVHLKSGYAMDYDYLMVSAGATHSYFGHTNGPSWPPASRPLKTQLRFAAVSCLLLNSLNARCWRRLSPAAELRRHRRRPHRSRACRGHLRHRQALYAA